MLRSHRDADTAGRHDDVLGSAAMMLLPAPAPIMLLGPGKVRGRKPSAPRPAIRLRRPIRIFSSGNGTQSVTVMVLQALGKLTVPYDIFAFANVGKDSENPETLEYTEKYIKPFLADHGIAFWELQKKYKKQLDTLVQALYRDSRSIIIPARMSGSGALGNRNCTDDYKIEVIDRMIRSLHYIHAVVGLGISTDEITRVKDTDWHEFYGKRKIGFVKKREYPLIDLRMNRQACKEIIASVGLPEPPKSSCYFCPFHKKGEWVEMKRDKPELFQKAVEIERQINRKRTEIGRDGLFLHPALVPLDQAVGNQPRLFEDETEDVCDTGYCWT
jgi:hypothetical protein